MWLGSCAKAEGSFSPGWWLQPELKGSDKISSKIIEKKSKFFLDFFEFPYFRIFELFNSFHSPLNL
jgi:hypothetical protein